MTTIDANSAQTSPPVPHLDTLDDIFRQAGAKGDEQGERFSKALLHLDHTVLPTDSWHQSYLSTDGRGARG